MDRLVYLGHPTPADQLQIPVRGEVGLLEDVGHALANGCGRRRPLIVDLDVVEAPVDEPLAAAPSGLEDRAEAGASEGDRHDRPAGEMPK